MGVMANFSGLSSRKLLNKLFQDRKNDGKIVRPLQKLTHSRQHPRSASGLIMCNCKKGKGKGVECRDHDFYETDFDTFDRSVHTFNCSSITNVVQDACTDISCRCKYLNKHVSQCQVAMLRDFASLNSLNTASHM